MLQGRTPYELVTGNTPDISEYTDFNWYENIWYHDQKATFPDDKRKLAKWLSVAHCVGQALCYYVLPASGRPIVRSTIQALSEDKLHSVKIQQQLKDFDLQIENNIAEVKHEPPLIESQNQTLQDINEPYEPEAEKPEVADYTPTGLYDALISAEVILPKGDILVPATVTRRKRDADGNPAGMAHPNPIRVFAQLVYDRKKGLILPDDVVLVDRAGLPVVYQHFFTTRCPVLVLWWFLLAGVPLT
jgi:hypothetical protein